MPAVPVWELSVPVIPVAMTRALTTFPNSSGRCGRALLLVSG